PCTWGHSRPILERARPLIFTPGCHGRTHRRVLRARPARLDRGRRAAPARVHARDLSLWSHGRMEGSKAARRSPESPSHEAHEETQVSSALQKRTPRLTPTVRGTPISPMKPEGAKLG